MKRTTLTIVMATLCLIFKAEAQNNKAVDVTSKGIQIGQKVPDVTLTNLHNYKDKNGKLASSAKLSDFRGKLLILDFWATWCAPCVAMFPKIDSLKKQFGNRIQFVSVTNQKGNEVLPFLNKYEISNRKHIDVPILVEDAVLHRLFPHKYLPHYVWLDENLTVKAITGSKEIDFSHISKMLSNKSTEFRKKRDMIVEYDEDRPLLLDGNGGNGLNTIYHSLFSRYLPGLGITYNVNMSPHIDGYRFTMTNQPITFLFANAYGNVNTYYNLKRIKVLSKDSLILTQPLRGEQMDTWLSANAYCYEIIVPKKLKSEIFNLAKADLHRMFPQYRVSVVPQKQVCMVLRRTSNQDLLISKGGKSISEFGPFGFTLQNFTLDRLIGQLNEVYMQNSPYWIIDETGYRGRVDLKISASLKSFEEINAELAPFGLQFTKTEKQVDMLVIQDQLK